jgi:formate dehydrogenase subunit gamma
MEERNGWNRSEVVSIVESLKARPGPLLLILHRIQDTFGYIPRESVPTIASMLSLSRAEVHGVISFYHDFRMEPRGRNLVKVCRAESCQAMGANALSEHACERLGVNFGETTSDGAFTLEPVYCLGNCACSPTVMVNDVLYGRVDAKRFDEIVRSVGAARR